MAGGISAELRSYINAQPPASKNVQQNGGSDFATMRQELRKQESDMIELVFAELENQCPNLTGEGSNNKQDVLGPISDIYSAKAINMLAETMCEAAKRQEDASKLAMLNLNKSKVCVDNSERDFNGKDIKFNFEILNKTIPQRASVYGILTIQSKNAKDGDKQVFKKKIYNLQAGQNTFTWDGTKVLEGGKSDGEKVEHGKYKASIQAFYTAHDAPNDPIPLNVSLDTNSTVVAVDIHKRTATLENGQVVGIDAINKVRAPEENTSKNDKKEIDYATYIDKSVELVAKEVDFVGNRNTKVAFFSDEDKTDKMNIKIVFERDNKLAAVSEKEMIVKKGINYFTWNGFKTTNQLEMNEAKKGTEFPQVEHGTYTYKVSMLDPNSHKPKWISLNNSKIVEVAATQEENGQEFIIVRDKDGEKKYDVGLIKGVVGGSSVEELHSKASSYPNKPLRVANNIIHYNGSKANITLSIPEEADIDNITEVRARILDKDGREVNIIKFNKETLEHIFDEYENSVVKYDEVDAATQIMLNHWITTQKWEGVGVPFITDYKSLAPDSEEKKKADEHLKKLVRPKVTLQWNGLDGNNKKVGNGDYTYEATYMQADESGKKSWNSFPYMVDATVKSAKVDETNRAINLTLNTGMVVKHNDLNIQWLAVEA